MSVIGLTAVTCFLAITLSYIGKAESSTLDLDRFEAIGRKEKEQSEAIELLTQQTKLLNDKLTHLSDLNHDLQQTVSDQGKALENQGKVIDMLKKDLKLQKITMRDCRREMHILQLKEQEIETRLDETKKRTVNPEVDIGATNENTATENGSNDDTVRYKKLISLNSRQSFTDKEVTSKAAARVEGKHNIERFVANVPNGPIAFQASLHRGANYFDGYNNVIDFQNVDLNLGGGYQNGHFIAPRPGIYMFSLTVTTDHGTQTPVFAAIEKNGNILAKVTSDIDEHTTLTRDQSSVTIVTMLNVGDEIKVINIYSNHFTLFGDKFTNFMGILVTES